MAFLFLSFFAGALSVLAPCILPLLPVVVGSSASSRSRATPYIVVGALALSIIAFTYLLKVSTAFIRIPPETWTYLSGGILILFGLTLVFPALWESIPGMARFSANSNKLVGKGYQKKSFWGDVIVGAALGPVFSSCSPTYFVILASVLPASFLLGTAYLLAYVCGLALVLLALAVLGERLSARLDLLANPNGIFKRVIGVLFLILGIFIVLGWEKQIETALLTNGFDVTRVEQQFLGTTGTGVAPAPAADSPTATSTATSTVEGPTATPESPTDAAKKAVMYTKSPELAGIDAYLNTGGKPVTIGGYRGKKVVLVDFWTYSCINCQRTTPYLTKWYDTYEKDGLVIIGVHTPEFSFEHLPENVSAAMAKEGIRYPVVLDNEYKTWNAFGNQYWPRKYLIDVDGYVVYDHIGEGDYDKTEAAIRKALDELHARTGTGTTSSATGAPGGGEPVTGSPETYFGWHRNEFLGNGTPYQSGSQTYTLPAAPSLNRLYLGGTWDMQAEYAVAPADGEVEYQYNAKDVYLVVSADSATDIEVLQDGVAVPSTIAGEDVHNGILTAHESRLYTVISNPLMSVHTLTLKVKKGGIRFYTFTFG